MQPANPPIIIVSIVLCVSTTAFEQQHQAKILKIENIYEKHKLQSDKAKFLIKTLIMSIIGGLNTQIVFLFDVWYYTIPICRFNYVTVDLVQLWSLVQLRVDKCSGRIWKPLVE